MNKRRRLVLLNTLLICALSAPALADKSCQPTPQGSLCLSQVKFDSFSLVAYQHQLQSQWCWAACISMLFRYYGHPVSQQRIVSEVYGVPANMPAMAGIVMARQLNRRWVDDNGKAFTSQLTAAYDFDAQVNTVSNAWLANELNQNHPIVIGTGSHAVVVTAMQYYETAGGPNVVSVGVFDPWPGVGPRGLTPVEMRAMHLGGALRFVATVRVS